MAKQTLPVDFQDDLLNVSMGEKRRYRMIYNSDGTVSLEDVTVYDRIGSNFGSGQINSTNQAVNESFDKNKLIRDLGTINALTEEGFAPDALVIKQLNDSLENLRLEWKLIGTDNTQVVPNNAKEVYVLCTYGDTGNSTSIFIPWSTRGIGNGWRNFGGGGHNSEIQISGDSIINHTTGYTMRVYYR